ncbi:MAG: BtpA/SgcQ family protein [Patescibacteria group bacterium]
MKKFSLKVRPAVISMIHFSPLEGTEDYEGDKAVVLGRAQQDLRALQKGGVDAILFENNFDKPKHEKMRPETRAHFMELLEVLVPETHVSWGITPLWNDFAFGFEACKKLGGVMVRVPVFVDSVETVYGKFYANPAAVLAARAALGAEGVAILADVQVKHATMLTPRPFVESVREASASGADGVIVTGQWTGDPPSVEQCAEAVREAGDAAVLTGSGMTAENFTRFAPYLDATIVGTAFKEGDVDLSKRLGPNIVVAARRYDAQKIADFMAVARSVRRS